MSGTYCRTESSLRSPVLEYALDYDSDYNGSYEPTVSPIGGVTNWWHAEKTSDSDTPNGDVCEKGNYCGNGVSSMTSCTAGYYCPDEFMKVFDSSLTCREGFYCKSGSYSMTPGNPIYWTDPDNTPDPTGDICRVGHYCVANSSKQTTCDPGSFMPYEMADEATDCIDCP